MLAVVGFPGLMFLPLVLRVEDLCVSSIVGIGWSSWLVFYFHDSGSSLLPQALVLRPLQLSLPKFPAEVSRFFPSSRSVNDWAAGYQLVLITMEWRVWHGWR